MIKRREALKYDSNEENLLDFKIQLQKFSKGKKLLDKLPDVSKIRGGELARRTQSIFGGTDLSFNAKTTLKEMGFILQDAPGLINLVPKEDAPLVLEFMKQNQGDIYEQIFDIYNK